MRSLIPAPTQAELGWGTRRAIFDASTSDLNSDALRGSARLASEHFLLCLRLVFDEYQPGHLRRLDGDSKQRSE
jgi:hypothetical protein